VGVSLQGVAGTCLSRYHGSPSQRGSAIFAPTTRTQDIAPNSSASQVLGIIRTPSALSEFRTNDPQFSGRWVFRCRVGRRQFASGDEGSGAIRHQVILTVTTRRDQTLAVRASAKMSFETPLGKSMIQFELRQLSHSAAAETAIGRHL
jgi:hypothetical protein